ncbi:MAG: TraR/DksA family transcriptional regulator [Actinomycetota bacterium]
MDQSQLEQLKAALEAERTSVAHQLREHGVPDGENVEVAVDEGFADSGQATAERSQLISMIDGLRTHLRAVDAALQRIEEGTYGRCERCGREIPFERLEARPTATLCVTHATGA